jgi:pantetheine-phosphate adenylyltransferase
MSKIIFPGSFDPITIGHIDLIKRIAKIYDEVTIAVLVNKNKDGFLDIDTRVKLVEGAITEEGIKNIKVKSSNKLLVDFCEEENNYLVLRGLRNTTDLALEQNMYTNNLKLDEKIEFLCLLTRPELSHISSTSVREILNYSKKIQHLVPTNVYNYLKEKNENL